MTRTGVPPTAKAITVTITVLIPAISNGKAKKTIEMMHLDLQVKAKREDGRLLM